MGEKSIEGRITPFRVGELARVSGLSTDTLYRYVRAGQLRAVRMGRTVRIPADEARRLLGLAEDESHRDGSSRPGAWRQQGTEQ